MRAAVLPGVDAPFELRDVPDPVGGEKVVVRVLDPMRAQWYEEQGLLTVCPTQKAIEMLQSAVGVTDGAEAA